MKTPHLNVLAAATLTALGCGPSSPQGAPEEPEELTVTFSLDGLHRAAIGEPFVVEATVSLDGAPYTAHEWRWSIESFGHDEAPERLPGGVERVTITPQAVGTNFTVWGQVGLVEEDGRVDWRSVKGPVLSPWGGATVGINAQLDAATLAVGERRPVSAQVQGEREVGGGRINQGRGHEPITYTSSDPGVATVSPAGLVEAIAPGQAEVTASVGAFSHTWSVTVDPTLQAGAPGTDPIPLEYPVEGFGAVDARGYPVFPIWYTNTWFEGSDQILDTVVLGVWTGTGLGMEVVSRPVDKAVGAPRIVRGFDGMLHVGYTSAWPTQRVVVASRPIDGGPDDWIHREVTSAMGGHDRVLNDHDTAGAFTMRARPDGGVWVAFGKAGAFEEATDPEGDDKCAFIVSLATVDGAGVRVEHPLVRRERYIRTPSGVACPDYLFEEVGARKVLDQQGRFEIRPRPGDRPDILGLVDTGSPTELVWDPANARWERRSFFDVTDFVLATGVDDPTLPSVVATHAGNLPPPSLGLIGGWVMGDRLHVATLSETSGAQNTLKTYAVSSDTPDVTLLADVRPPTYPAGEIVAAWAAGQGRVFAAGDHLVDATPPRDLGVTSDDPAHPLGAALGQTTTGSVIAFDDGEVMVRGAGGARDVVFWRPGEATVRVLESNRQGDQLEAVARADETLYGHDGALNTELFYSVDRGVTWLRAAGPEDLPYDVFTSLRDASGRTHRVDRVRAGASGALEWSTTEADGTPGPAATFDGFRWSVLDCPFGFTSASRVMPDGTLIACMGRVEAGGGVGLRLGVGALEPATFDDAVVGVLPSLERIDTTRDVFEVVQRADGTLVAGFTGWDVRTNTTLGVLVARGPEGWGDPHLLRPTAGAHQQLVSLAALPDGSLAAVVRDGVEDHLVHVTDLSPDAELGARWRALLPAPQ